MLYDAKMLASVSQVVKVPDVKNFVAGLGHVGFLARCRKPENQQHTTCYVETFHFLTFVVLFTIYDGSGV